MRGKAKQEFLEKAIKLNEEIKKIAKEEFMNNVMKQLDSALIFTYIQKLENQLQQKENIIKEVREYIMSELITEWDIENDGYVSGSDLPADAITPILEMLDKE